jgi:hypothetical protein
LKEGRKQGNRGKKKCGEMLLEQIISKPNMRAAYARVVSNKGAGGVDGVEAENFAGQLKAEWETIRTGLEAGVYQPKAVRRVKIPKPNGGERKLGIPTYMDRLIQQAISQELTKMYDPEFSENSYGFRSAKSAHQALEKAKEYINAGYSHVVDLDLEKFFDRVNHDYLMNELSRKITDKRVLKLIHKILRAEIQEDGKATPSKEGVPQGGPLALRTHPQTLSLLEGLKLNGGDFSFGYFINSSIFMINEKITEFGVGRKDQSGARLIGTKETAFRHCGAINGNVWCISDTSLSLCSAGKREQTEDRHSGNLCGIYSETVTQSDWSGKGICYFTENLNQQSSQGSIGRVFSQKTPWPKRRNKLRYLIPMTACGSKNSHRFTISLSQSSQLSFLPQILSLHQ